MVFTFSAPISAGVAAFRGLFFTQQHVVREPLAFVRKTKHAFSTGAARSLVSPPRDDTTTMRTVKLLLLPLLHLSRVTRPRPIYVHRLCRRFVFLCPYIYVGKIV